MVQTRSVEVDSTEFQLSMHAVMPIFKPQDNGFPYRLWPMSVCVSGDEGVHAAARSLGGARMRGARARISTTIIGAPQQGQTKVG